MTKISWLLGLWVLSWAVLAQASNATPTAQWKQLDFYTDPGVNFHHFLYHMARTQQDPEQLPWRQTLTPPQSAVLQTLIERYRHFLQGPRPSMRTHPQVKKITQSLIQQRAQEVKRLPDPELSTEFNLGLSIYVDGLWPRHVIANQTWLNKLMPKLTALGDTLLRSLNSRFDTLLLSEQRHPVDVVFYPGNWQGAYTQVWPYTVVNSSQDAYQGYAALEMLFHEISHARGTRPLIRQVKQQLNSMALERYTRIWHPIQFFIVGKTTEQILARHNIAYQQYAEVQGLFSHGFYKQVKPLLEEVWLPHVQSPTPLNVPIGATSQRLKQQSLTLE